MQKYDSYKDSGIEWIGEIPSHWEVMPLKNLGTMNKGLTFTKADIVEKGTPAISYGQIHSKDNTGTKLNPLHVRYIPDTFTFNAVASLVQQGDFIFADTSEDLEGAGNAVYIDTDEKIYGGYHTIVLRTPNTNNKYFAYLFLTDCWRSQIRSQVSGVKVYSITQSILTSTKILTPSIVERDAIANFLDSKSSKIDKLISTQEKRIELLKELKQSILTHTVTRGINPDAKLKESGDVWIGLIPEHWDFVPLKRVAKVILGKMLQSESLHDSDSLEKYICAKDVHFDGIDTSDLKLMYFSPLEKKLYQVNKGDMLIVEGGAGAGGCSVVSEDIQDTYIQNSIMIIRGNINCLDNRYVCNFFTSIAKRGYIDMVTNVATIPHFSKEKVQSTIIPLPPIEEQKEIADYLYKRVSKIEKSIEVALHRIKLLKEYKQSLITEVVTGKRKVI